MVAGKQGFSRFSDFRRGHVCQCRSDSAARHAETAAGDTSGGIVRKGFRMAMQALAETFAIQRPEEALTASAIPCTGRVSATCMGRTARRRSPGTSAAGSCGSGIRPGVFDGAQMMVHDDDVRSPGGPERRGHRPFAFGRDHNLSRRGGSGATEPLRSRTALAARLRAAPMWCHVRRRGTIPRWHRTPRHASCNGTCRMRSSWLSPGATVSLCRPDLARSMTAAQPKHRT